MLKAPDAVPPLLGRDTEQRLLASLLDTVAEEGQALVLRGEPGVGKSRLLAETAQAARSRGMSVLTMAGVQSETDLPFGGIHQLLRPVRARAADLPEVHREALDAAFALTREVAPEHFRIAMAALDLLSEVAGEMPLLVVAEDAQWLDHPSADVLAFIARRIESDQILLIVALRDRLCICIRRCRPARAPARGARRGDSGDAARRDRPVAVAGRTSPGAGRGSREPARAD